MRLCAQCQACIDGTAKQLEGMYLQHHTSSLSWLEALEFGCVLCREMRHCLQDQTEEAETAQFDPDGLEQTAAFVHRRGYQLMRFSSYDKNMGKSSNVITSFTFVPKSDVISPEDPSVPSALLEDHTHHHSTGSPEVLRLAQSWLQDCRAHTACSGWGPSTWLPLRLIDVQPSEPNIGFRVIDTTITKVSGRYATLSHCWGKDSDILSLRQSTKSDLFRGLRLDALPRTFKDAISVCRSLGTPYLWIDSLCILQDNQQDWKEQSRQMCHVYREAEYNISADASRNSHEGLFREYRGHFRAQQTVRTRQRNIFGLILDDGDYDVVNSYTWTRDIALSPLNLRAWVFQERHLARRILHFTRCE